MNKQKKKQKKKHKQNRARDFLGKQFKREICVSN